MGKHQRRDREDMKGQGSVMPAEPNPELKETCDLTDTEYKVRTVRKFGEIPENTDRVKK